MHKLLLSSGIVCVSLLALMAAVMVVSAALSPPTAAVAGIDDCILPCWNRIHPGITALAEAEDLLAQVGYQVEGRYPKQGFVLLRPVTQSEVTCSVSLAYVSRRVTGIGLSECGTIRFGDMVGLMGRPDGLLPSATALAFREGRVVVTLNTSNCDVWYGLQTPIDFIRLQDSLEGYTTSLVEPLRWRGFLRRERYEQLEPSMAFCGRS